MHSADVNQAIRIILVELYPIISAEDVTVYVSIFQRSSSFFLQEWQAKAEYLPNSQQADYIDMKLVTDITKTLYCLN